MNEMGVRLSQYVSVGESAFSSKQAFFINKNHISKDIGFNLLFNRFEKLLNMKLNRKTTNSIKRKCEYATIFNLRNMIVEHKRTIKVNTIL